MTGGERFFGEVSRVDHGVVARVNSRNSELDRGVYG